MTDAEPGRAGDARSGGDISQVIVSASADGIVAVDERGIIRLCNPAAADLFARSTRELIGTQFGFPIVAGESAEIDLMLPGGGRRVVEMRVTATILEGERLYVAALRDITRHTHAERELEAALDRQNIVVAIAAHELHNPLATISVLVDVLRDRVAALAEEQRADIVDRIAGRVARLQSLVRKLLIASTIDIGGVSGAAERVPVLEFMLEQLGELDGGSQDVHLSCSPDLVALVDRQEFSAMLGNYLENAFAYGRPPVEVSAVERAGWVEVRVRDHGAGVPEAFVPWLFERFSREPGVERETEGTGLGLWIVRSLARANGGDAWYEPDADGCFCLRLRRGDARSA
ncbi:PAS domain-containing sensor histidine kinase [Sphaerisporangium album]|uniref:PAS domain-containing sensor histidine kinase n=1 Tax=Sphaerisporangium album TaxID=509200 RepID=UPI0015EFEAC4|nr:PAS domain-containing sensor histidine kinase [Sphaerisporangium album]